MRERELSVCIWIHHTATFIGIAEGIYYLMERKLRFWKRCAIFIFTVFQTWAGGKIMADFWNGKSRLADSYKNLEKLKVSNEQKRGILWGLALSSALFKILPVCLTGRQE